MQAMWGLLPLHAGCLYLPEQLAKIGSLRTTPPCRPSHPVRQLVRSVAPYFHAFRGRRSYLHLVENIRRARFVDLAHDISLLHSTASECAGTRLTPQIEAQLKRRSSALATRRPAHHGSRSLECVKEAVGLLRVRSMFLSLAFPTRHAAPRSIASRNFHHAQPIACTTASTSSTRLVRKSMRRRSRGV